MDFLQDGLSVKKKDVRFACAWQTIASLPTLNDSVVP